jgi:hypothetical protein
VITAAIGELQANYSTTLTRMTKLQILDLTPAKDSFISELQQIEIDRIYGGINSFQSMITIDSIDISKNVGDINRNFATAVAQIPSDFPNNPFPTIQYTENNVTYTNTEPFKPGITKLGSASVFAS